MNPSVYLLTPQFTVLVANRWVKFTKKTIWFRGGGGRGQTGSEEGEGGWGVRLLSGGISQSQLTYSCPPLAQCNNCSACQVTLYTTYSTSPPRIFKIYIIYNFGKKLKTPTVQHRVISYTYAMRRMSLATGSKSDQRLVLKIIFIYFCFGSHLRIWLLSLLNLLQLYYFQTLFSGHLSQLSRR